MNRIIREATMTQRDNFISQFYRLESLRGSFPGRLHGCGGIWYNTRNVNKFAISFDLIITLGGCRSAEEVVV